ncbi:hypothetical protein CVT25_012723 [Psilocybe cyanescens]|uniref:Uncharacterized protein n=1 Tax=Psilocybe cyanescens TaxID=93625 RepID=A0A409XSI2_PSICY|nr:hypothetical protein CVT25_012723 [Psilocybe cyanescens]
MSEVLANFSCLDELTQVIYQSIYKFVVLSTVTDGRWNIYIGLSGPQGRWWHGFWTEADIHRIFVCIAILQRSGSKSSDKLLETFAEKLAEVFIQGEMCISDWSADKGADIKFTLGPTSKKPMHVSLVEMSPEDAAAHATSVFIDIALQAQSRKCRLYPSASTDYSSVPVASSATLQMSHVAAPSISKRKEMSKLLACCSSVSQSFTYSLKGPEAKPSEECMERSSSKFSVDVEKETNSQLKNMKQQRGSSAQKPPAAVRTHKGASLANPNKKARKYKPIEFESDDE